MAGIRWNKREVIIPWFRVGEDEPKLPDIVSAVQLAVAAQAKS